MDETLEEMLLFELDQMLFSQSESPLSPETEVCSGAFLSWRAHFLSWRVHSWVNSSDLMYSSKLGATGRSSAKQSI